MVLQGKVVAVKKAQAKQGKIYVGKLMPELSDEDIKTHFTQVGTVFFVKDDFYLTLWMFNVLLGCVGLFVVSILNIWASATLS